VLCRCRGRRSGLRDHVLTWSGVLRTGGVPHFDGAEPLAPDACRSDHGLRPSEGAGRQDDQSSTNAGVPWVSWVSRVRRIAMFPPRALHGGPIRSEHESVAGSRRLPRVWRLIRGYGAGWGTGSPARVSPTLGGSALGDRSAGTFRYPPARQGSEDHRYRLTSEIGLAPRRPAGIQHSGAIGPLPAASRPGPPEASDPPRSRSATRSNVRLCG
jgi:hypothetical protein